jgi:hypothetical protein
VLGGAVGGASESSRPSGGVDSGGPVRGMARGYHDRRAGRPGRGRRSPGRRQPRGWHLSTERAAGPTVGYLSGPRTI